MPCGRNTQHSPGAYPCKKFKRIFNASLPLRSKGASFRCAEYIFQTSCPRFRGCRSSSVLVSNEPALQDEDVEPMLLKVLGFRASSPPLDRLWGIWGSYCNMPKAVFYLLQGDYKDRVYRLRIASHRTGRHCLNSKDSCCDLWSGQQANSHLNPKHYQHNLRTIKIRTTVCTYGRRLGFS